MKIKNTMANKMVYMALIKVPVFTNPIIIANKLGQNTFPNDTLDSVIIGFLIF